MNRSLQIIEQIKNLQHELTKQLKLDYPPGTEFAFSFRPSHRQMQISTGITRGGNIRYNKYNTIRSRYLVP